LLHERQVPGIALIRNWLYTARLLRWRDNKGRMEMDALKDHIHSRRAVNGTTMFHGTVMAGFLVSTLLTSLPSVTFAEGLGGDRRGDKARHSLVQHPYGLKAKSPFATTFATVATLQVSMDALVEDMAGLKAQVDQLTVANTKLTEANAALQVALNAAKADISTVSVKVAALDTKAADIIPGLGKYLKVDTANVLNGVKAPHILVTGANVHVRSGSGFTNDNGTLTGLGNLIVGYNETPAFLSRTGSHNLVGGSLNSFSSFGGMVFGLQNTISGQYANVLGGNVNTAVGPNSTVYGGMGQTTVNLNSYAPQGARPASGQ
jgi:hypothetical protein